MCSIMKISSFWLTLFCCIGVVFWSFSQEDEAVQQQLELFMEQNQSEDIDLTLLIEQLDGYKQHPLDLNTATYATLLQFPLLNEFQVKTLLQHREDQGKLLSVYELQSVNYWDTTTIVRILPYVTVDDKLDNLQVIKKKKRSKNGMEGARAGGCRCWGIGIVIMLSDVLLLSRSNPSECRHGTEGLFTLSISGAREREALRGFVRL